MNKVSERQPASPVAVKFTTKEVWIKEILQLSLASLYAASAVSHNQQWRWPYKTLKSVFSVKVCLLKAPNIF